MIHGPEMTEILRIAKRIAAFNTTVLITGETGTGKDVVANILHQFSSRRDKPFIKINCSAISENLFESELFGYERGSFTGALKDGRAGYFEEANHGTLFLDEIGDMSLSSQVKLLRVLQSKEVVRIGSSKAVSVDVRVILATNRNSHRPNISSVISGYKQPSKSAQSIEITGFIEKSKPPEIIFFYTLLPLTA